MQILDNIINEYQDGASFNVFVTPGSKRSCFPAGYNNWRKCIEIKVSSPAKNNKANKEIIKTLAEFFETSINKVFLISGTNRKEKTVYIKDVSVRDITIKLKESLNGL